MKVFKRLHILTADEQSDRASYKEEYWALRSKYNIKDGVTLEPLDEDQRKAFREEVKKLKQKYNIKSKSKYKL